MLHKARSTRLLPGKGELPVRALVAELRDLGYTGPWSVEVNDPWFRALPVDEAARQAFDSATAVLNG
ncbi:hypothetical protein SVIO_003970 [Streptomyces violaceusniger]|uniref:Xylose isomerase-like TIM barrel domain-containing protein n=2 Tax=Streptomyces violaceusniger TaxID=68280 RepID=A0A4D4KNK3_STRVO|nr:hypothetical protein SVIO_003970 [Streptomyces violaceusniger]